MKMYFLLKMVETTFSHISLQGCNPILSFRARCESVQKVLDLEFLGNQELRSVLINFGCLILVHLKCRMTEK